MDQVIRLRRDDDVFKIQAVIAQANRQRVILVVPRGAKALDSEYELTLVQRWANEEDAQVALVGGDFALREMASAVGLPVFSLVEQAKQTRWQWRHNGAPKFERVTDDESATQGKFELAQLGLAGNQLLITVLMFVAATCILAGAAVLLVPSARITIYPASQTISDSREVILDSTITTIDQVNNILPATLFRLEISGTASIATAKLSPAPADHASGNVVFTNLAGTQSTIPAGTMVETSSGVTVRFTTTVPAELPAGYNARVTVPVRAVDAGPVGNVRALQVNVIEGPLQAVARVVNPNPMTGGNIKQVRVVSSDDKIKLREKLTNELRTGAVASLQKQAGAQAFILPVSVQVSVVSESFDHLVDDPADNLSLHIEAVGSGLSVDRVGLEKFAEGILSSKIPAGYIVLPNTLNVAPDTNARIEGNAVIFNLRSSLRITPQVQGRDVLNGLSGKSRDTVSAMLVQKVQASSPPKIEISPAWFPVLPFSDFRLALFIDTEVSSK